MSFVQPYYGYQQPIYPNYSYNQQQFPVQQQVNSQAIPQQINVQQSQVQSNNTIPCEYVDNLDVVNAKNCDFSGKPMLYMKTDGTAIYRKQLNIETGKSKTYTYELREESDIKSRNTDISNITAMINSQIESLRQEFTQSIGDLKEMVMNLNISVPNNIADSTQKTTTSTRKAVSK